MLIYLPSGPHGEKVGVDDYLASGRSVDELMALASHELRVPVDHGDDDNAPYRMDDGGITWVKRTSDGPVSVPLTNFTAKIVADIVEDDGVEERRSFAVEATLRGRTSRFQVPVSQFAGMSWATEQLGAAAACFPGNGTRDHARFAIQSCSGDVPLRRIYSHTGWRQVDSEWAFLHREGATKAEGLERSVETQLTGALARFGLPDAVDAEARSAATEASLQLLNLGPREVAVPLVGAIYLAPLCELLGPDRPDMVLWFHGPSGAFKSEAAALAQSHFGTFGRQTLPASFTDTPNAIERILFSAKDVLVVVDDFHPAQDRREEQAMSANASRLLRGVGNGSGRQRMRADTSLRPDLPPRGLAIATGERLPSGHSTAARMFPIPVGRGEIPQDRLTEAQSAVNEYPVAMAGYVQWLAERFEELSPTLKARFSDLRAAARDGGHPRSAGQVAHLQIGIETVLRFAVDLGAIDAGRAAGLRADAWRTLTNLGQSHQADLASESPVRTFLALLTDGLAGRKALVESLEGTSPDQTEAFGWLEREYVDAHGERRTEYVRPNGAAFLGHVDDEWVYLIPEPTMQFVSSAASASGRHFPVDQKTLLRRLDEAGLIAVQGGRRVVNQRFFGTTRRVIKLRRSALSPSSEEGEQREHGEREQRLDASGRDPVNADGNDSREQPDWQLPTVPAVPAVPASGNGEDDREVMVL
jgi:hypothetical protein